MCVHCFVFTSMLFECQDEDDGEEKRDMMKARKFKDLLDAGAVDAKVAKLSTQAAHRLQCKTKLNIDHA
jgi:hypothetical protein